MVFSCLMAKCSLREAALPLPLSSWTVANSTTWTLTNNLLEPRYLHHLTLLADGKVLLAGGFNATDLTGDVELYDPANGT